MKINLRRSVSLIYDLRYDIFNMVLVSQATDKELIDLLVSTLDSPYANYLIRQFVLTAITKISSRTTTSSAEQDRIAEVLAKYTTSPELELQQRAVEFASLFSLGDLRSGVLERMPPPELKATVMGVG
jgi:AP-1 complex subunit gamma-1